MASIKVTRLAAGLGAEVGGVDLSKPIGEAAFAAIGAAWLEYAVLRFRGQKLSDPELIAFTRHFGELDPPRPNPYGKPFVPQHPELHVISNIKLDGPPIGALGARQPIRHPAMPYLAQPPIGAIPHALDAPASR